MTPAQSDHAAVITKFYPQAGALEYFQHTASLPPVYSGHRGTWYFGRPADDVQTVIAVGLDEDYLRDCFGTVRPAGKVRNPDGNLIIGNPRIWVCESPLEPWPRLWRRFRVMGFGQSG